MTPSDVLAAVQALAANRPEARRLGQAGRARVDAHFTIERMVSDYSKVYASCVG